MPHGRAIVARARIEGIVAWAACLVALSLSLWRVVIPAAGNPGTVGFATCYAESRMLIEGKGDLRYIYDDGWFQERIDGFLGQHVAEIAHGQPPTMSLILAPLAWLPPREARAAWVLTSALLWGAGLALLAHGLSFPRVRGIPPVVWFAAVATIYRPAVENFRRGQGYALLFFLLVLVVWIILRAERRQWWAAGVPLALMLLLKSAGLWLYPLLLVSRQWRVLIGAALAATALVLCTWPWIGGDAWRAYVADAFAWLASEPSNHVTAYQTLQSMLGHLFVGHPRLNPRPIAHLPVLAGGLALSIIGGAFAISARFQRLDSESRDERALTMGMFMALLVPVAPIGEGYHYMLVFPAIAIAWWWAARSQTTLTARLVLAGCTILICAPQRYYDSPLVQNGAAALLAYPLVYGGFGLWVWQVFALRRLERINCA